MSKRFGVIAARTGIRAYFETAAADFLENPTASNMQALETAAQALHNLSGMSDLNVEMVALSGKISLDEMLSAFSDPKIIAARTRSDDEEWK